MAAMAEGGGGRSRAQLRASLGASPVLQCWLGKNVNACMQMPNAVVLGMQKSRTSQVPCSSLRPGDCVLATRTWAEGSPLSPKLPLEAWAEDGGMGDRTS